jgi:hypothetical protein
MDIIDCNKGNHNLKLITIVREDTISADVVRWCDICGAIVIDTDYDHRTNPGAIMKMRFPDLAKNAK